MPLQSGYDDQACSIAGALGLVGERWTLLIVRDAFLGLRRFDEFQAELGIARNVLQTRLERLVDEGILEKRLYSERPPRHEYRLTEKGIDLWPIIQSLMTWGDQYAHAPGGPAVIITHKGCGGELDAHRICTECGARVTAREATGLPGPGAGPDHPLRRRHPLEDEPAATQSTR